MATDGLKRRAERAKARLDGLRPPPRPAGPTLGELGDARAVELADVLLDQQWLDEAEVEAELARWRAEGVEVPPVSRAGDPAYEQDGVVRLPRAQTLAMARELVERIGRAERRRASGLKLVPLLIPPDQPGPTG
jgi:hypothetical protein